MARPPNKRGRASDLGGTLGGLLRSTLAQAGVVREALERGARSGRAALDEALGDAAQERRRTAALAELGQIVFELVQQGELDLAELPEIHEVVERLERLDGASEHLAPSRSRRASQRASAAGGEASVPPPLEDDSPEYEDDEEGAAEEQERALLLGGARGRARDGDEEETFVGNRRRTIPLPRRELFGQERSAREQRQQAVTQRMRATRPLPLEGEDDAPPLDDGDEDADFAHRLAAARDAVDGTVTSSSWRPPPPRHQAEVWRPRPAAATSEPEQEDASERERVPTARLRPARAAEAGQPVAAEADAGEPARRDEPATTRSIDMPLAELRTVEDEATSAPRERDALTALTERSPFGSRRGGISFDDDLEEYMHPDDLPSKAPA